MLNNITKKQKIFLWIMAFITAISVWINPNISMVCGIFFWFCFLCIEIWNNVGEKQQLKKRIKELETQIHDKPKESGK